MFERHAVRFYASVEAIDADHVIAELAKIGCAVRRCRSAAGQDYLDVVTDRVGQAMGLYIELGGRRAGPGSHDALIIKRTRYNPQP